MSSPRSLAPFTSCAIAAFSAADSRDEDDRSFLASLGIELAPVIVSVIGDQPSHQQPLACQARNTVCRTFPLLPVRPSSPQARCQASPGQS